MSHYDKTWKDQEKPIVINLDTVELYFQTALIILAWAFIVGVLA